MITLPAVILAARKTFVWCKHHLFLVGLITGFIVVLVLFPYEAPHFADMIDKFKRSRRQELEALDKVVESAVTDERKAADTAIEKVIVAEEKHDEAVADVEARKEKEVEKLSDSDPDVLTRKLAEMTGARVWGDK
jgi:uncharacterized membrane protein YgaE (UPF0421/DUF939 family)